jgi:hypothetical protein
MIVSVDWDGLELNPGVPDEAGMLAVVENVEGWYDSPPYDGRNAELVLVDGAQRGPKTASVRDVTITGVAIGPPESLARFRDKLVLRVASATSAELTIPDGAARAMTARVRCDSTAFRHTFSGPGMFRYQATLTAVDPRVYGPWQYATLVAAASGDGWTYSVPVEQWTAQVSAAPVATAFPWGMTLLGFEPGGTFSAPLWSSYNWGDNRSPLVLTSPAAASMDVGDIGLLTIATQQPMTSASVADSAGNNWQRVAEVQAWPGGSATMSVWLAEITAPMIGAGHTITTTRNGGNMVIVYAYSLKGLGPFLGCTGAGAGHSTTAGASIALTAQNAKIIAITQADSESGVLQVPLNPAGWTSIGSLTGGGPFTHRAVAAISPAALTAPVWPADVVRAYPRAYPARLASNEAAMLNQGTVAAPARAVFTGDLSQSRLVSMLTGRQLWINPVPAGAQIAIDTATLTATAPGGASRASYVRGGSQTMLVPAASTDTWSLYASGSGTVDLSWRSAWH